MASNRPFGQARRAGRCFSIGQAAQRTRWPVSCPQIPWRRPGSFARMRRCAQFDARGLAVRAPRRNARLAFGQNNPGEMGPYLRKGVCGRPRRRRDPDLPGPALCPGHPADARRRRGDPGAVADRLAPGRPYRGGRHDTPGDLFRRRLAGSGQGCRRRRGSADRLPAAGAYRRRCRAVAGRAGVQAPVAWPGAGSGRRRPGGGAQAGAGPGRRRGHGLGLRRPVRHHLRHALPEEVFALPWTRARAPPSSSWWRPCW